MLGCLSLYCFFVFGPPSLALEPSTPALPAKAGPSIQAFGQTHACSSWTDSCTICTTSDTGSAACSLPGIACTPGPITCTAPSP